MAGLKRELPGLRTSGTSTGNVSGEGVIAITPDEIDAYTQYMIHNPAAPTGIAQSWFFLGTSGTADVTAITPLNVITGYPRTAEFSITGSSAGEVGTVIYNGRDQFGSAFQESITFNAASNGGTANGTRIVAQLTSGTVYYGTFAGNGTARFGLGTTGTTTIFGLPVRLGASSDVKLMSLSTGTGEISINGGTIGTYVVNDGVRTGIRAPKDISGTYSLNILVKSTYNAEQIGAVANLSQRT